MDCLKSPHDQDEIQERQIKGTYNAQYAPLYQAFLSNLSQYNETGAAICVFHKGQAVVNLFASNESQSPPWLADHRVSVMSCSKAMLAICIHKLAADNKIVLNAPICRYWPEFATNSKAHITISSVLDHSAGIPCHKTGKPGDIFNWQASIHNIENTKPIFSVGRQLVYHALTFGHILGEIIHRVDGRMPSVFFEQEIAQPFDIDCSLTRNSSYRHRDIVKTSAFSSNNLKFMSHWLPRIPHWKCQYFKPCGEHYHPNSSQWHNSEIPAVTGHASAFGLAKLFAFLAGNGTLNGQTLLPKSQVQRLTQLSFAGTELVTKKHWRMGAGVMLNSPEFCPMGPNENAFGHMGMGGAIGFADPDAQLSFAYVTEFFHSPSKTDKSVSGIRLQKLVTALYRSLLTE
ncbi:serine hydrolase domain-containing protein [Pseudoalteromonas sp. Of7M-16]|uniref:serine hydrolase domain-containing protein n=1 Tax=Pseudoalteromonas sp. Of7M-16 TaxID=2917756 RepID=UPI001EF5B555|nr:serine hydrolase domain-containing protein [Pseudoalteromonas sp. Of7M-16]MCG7550217.1 beta-lactamase family protein [Pseudoalteromonas sp. Of7M-16]